MSVKTAGVGHFTIPTAPAAGTSVTSGAANAFTTTPVQLIASTAAALYITGVHLEAAAAKAATYIVVQLMTGAAAAETIVGQYLVPLSTGSTVALGYRQIYPPIPVAAGVRLSAKTADSVGTAATLVTLECIAQSNVVDDGITVGRVALVDTLTTYTGNTPQTGDAYARVGAAGAGLTALGDTRIANLDAAVSSRSTFAGGAVASVTAAVTLPAIPANWITAAGITAAALNGKGDWNIGKTGYALSAAGVQAVWDALTSALTTVGSIGKRIADNLDALVSSRSTYAGADTGGTTTLLGRLTAGRATNLDNLDAAVTTRLASAGYTAPDNAGIATIGGRLTAQRALNLDNLDAAVSTRSTYAGGDTAGTTTLLARLTAGRATALDNLDAAISSRLAATAYTVPDNVSVTAIKAKTDQLAFTVAGLVNANVERVRGEALTGTGTEADPWIPA